MKVLLVSPNEEKLPDPVFPIGAAYVAGALKQAGIEYHCLDLCFEEDVEKALIDALNKNAPDIVGLSLRNVDNVSYPHSVSYLPLYRMITTTVRRNCHARIVLGGSGFTLLPDAILRFLQADYGICGEGEITFVQLVRQLAGGPELLDLATDPIIRAGVAVETNLDRLPPADRTLFDNERYLQRGGMANLQTKRGCPFNCIYCTYPVIEGRKVRARSPRSICDEIQTLLDAGMDTLFMVDNEFNHPMDHALAVCREIQRRRLPVRWSCYANPAFIGPELVDAMLAAGCTSLEFGTDAGCDEMLKNLGKSFSARDIAQASATCDQAGMPYCHALLLGGPGETMTTAQKSLDTIAATGATAVICMVGIRIFPHTQLAATAEKEGRIAADEDFLNPVFYLADAVAEEMLPFLKAYAKHHPTWIFPGLEINMNAALQEKLRRFGVKGPLWEYMGIHKRRRRG